MTVRGDQLSQHAVVLGAGVAGLLAARVLAEVFGRVTVIDRDALPDDASGRRGVPQGRQVHGLESRGVREFNRLLPGLVSELADQGAVLIDDLSQMHYRMDGTMITQRPTPIHPFLLVSRPFLEHAIRRRVCALPGVSIRERLEVTRLLHRPGEGARVTRRAPGVQTSDIRVNGVQVNPAGEGPTEDIEADLVVDATGRGSRTPLWLDELGYPRPDEQVIPVQISYATRSLRVTDQRGLPPFLIEGTARPGVAGITLFRCEQGRTMLGVSGPREIFPSRVTGEWMLRMAEERLPRAAIDAVRAASAAADAGPVATYHVPSSVWRRYDRMSRFPAGLLILGDALCAFNPVYGQGMSVAAGQVQALRQVLRDDPVAAAPARFFTAAARPTVQAWRLTSGTDRAHAGGASGPERAALWVTALLLGQAFRVAIRDAAVARVLTGVTGLSEPRTALLRPRILAPLLISGGTRAVRRVVLSAPGHGSGAGRMDPQPEKRRTGRTG